MQITRYGQSALLVQEGATRLLIDPGELSGDEVFSLGDLTAVAFTHAHPDHCAPARAVELRRENPGALVLGPRSVLERLALQGDAAARELADGDVAELGALRIRVHGGPHQQIHPAVPDLDNLGFAITGASGLRLFHPGDSYLIAPNDVDVLALPIQGPWGSLRDAVAFADAVAPRRMFPIHDVHLSTTGRALFWPWIQGFARSGIEAFDPEHGQTVDLG